ncbi:MAG: hypothetical protein RSA57_09480 [Cetobacterium sp.]|uniref:hypothetical protein n=1 Tax=Cetobacterium sp. TaxID=2071632 RepID=UPI0025CEB92F|nr:hypothetical protein [uncultured Cetobacterium sp.]
MKKASEQKIFAKAYEIKEKIINSSKIINEIRYQYLKTYVRRSYEILDENIFYQNCQKLIELGEEYQNIFKNKKLPKIFIPPILHKDVLSVITYINTAYSKKILKYEDYASRELKKLYYELESSKISAQEINLAVENLRKDLENLQKKYNAKFAIIRLSSCDFRAKLRDQEKEIKRITLKEQGTFFLGTPKFYEQPPKSPRNDLFENKNGVYKINDEFYLSDLDDISLL